MLSFLLLSASVSACDLPDIGDTTSGGPAPSTGASATDPMVASDTAAEDGDGHASGETDEDTGGGTTSGGSPDESDTTTGGIGSSGYETEPGTPLPLPAGHGHGHGHR